MFSFFVKGYVQVHIDYLTKYFKMYPTHNVGKFPRLLKWFSEAQLLHPKISNDKKVGCLLSYSLKKKILWNHSFGMFEDEINNINKTRYSYLHT